MSELTTEVTEEIVMRELIIDELESVNGGRPYIPCYTDSCCFQACEVPELF